MERTFRQIFKAYGEMYLKMLLPLTGIAVLIGVLLEHFSLISILWAPVIAAIFPAPWLPVTAYLAYHHEEQEFFLASVIGVIVAGAVFMLVPLIWP